MDFHNGSPTMRILVVGAGAVGGYFGGRLLEAGRDVTFLVRPGRAERLRSDGLRIMSPHGNAVLHPKLVVAEQIAAPYDLVLLGVKAYGLEAAMEDFAPAVGPATLILPLLNGMRHIETLASKFGESAVLGGVCIVSTDLAPDGSIVQLADMQSVAYGERGSGPSARIRAVDAEMRGADFDAQLSESIVHDMWEKWIVLASLGCATCLARGNVGEIVGAPGGTDLITSIFEQCGAISTACGYPPRAAFVERARAVLTARGSTQTSSMFRDLSRGNPVEADQILGDLLERGRSTGVTASLVGAAFVSLRVYQARLAAESTT
jgi:2-dehydropantoate 2-reductase